MRLGEITEQQMNEWLVARQAAGSKRYGDAHLERYNLVDVMEELLDAQNILNLLSQRLLNDDRLRQPDDYVMLRLLFRLKRVFRDIEEVQDAIRYLDREIPSSYRLENVERVWWSDQGRSASDGAE